MKDSFNIYNTKGKQDKLERFSSGLSIDKLQKSVTKGNSIISQDKKIPNTVRNETKKVHSIEPIEKVAKVQTTVGKSKQSSDNLIEQLRNLSHRSS